MALDSGRNEKMHAFVHQDEDPALLPSIFLQETGEDLPLSLLDMEETRDIAPDAFPGPYHPPPAHEWDSSSDDPPTRILFQFSESLFQTYKELVPGIPQILDSILFQEGVEIPWEDDYLEIMREKEDLVNRFKATTKTIRTLDELMFLFGFPRGVAILGLQGLYRRLKKDLDDLVEKAKESLEETFPGDRDKQGRWLDLIDEEFAENLKSARESALKGAISSIADALGEKNIKYADSPVKGMINIPGLVPPEEITLIDPKTDQAFTGPDCPDHKVVIIRFDTGIAGCRPYAHIVPQPNCPKMGSPWLLNEGEKASDILSRMILNISNCIEPNTNWSIDCVRLALLCWILGGYAVLGQDFLDSYPTKKIYVGPLTGDGSGSERDDEDKNVWPGDKEGIPGLGRLNEPERGDVVWFQVDREDAIPTATIYVGEGKYMVPGKTVKIMTLQEVENALGGRKGGYRPKLPEERAGD